MPFAGPRRYPRVIVTTTPHSTPWIVAQVFGSTALVWDGRTTREAVLAGRLKAETDRTRSNALAVGDEVALEEGDAAPPRLIGVSPRRTHLERAATGSAGRGRMQVIAANADQAMIVASLTDPPFRPGLIDRWTLLALRGGMEPILCVNKTDLGSEAEAEGLAREARIPLPLHAVSAANGAGFPALLARLTGRATVMVGHSGVGKSSLLHRLVPDADAATGELSGRNRKGRHTTTSARLYPLPDGGHLVDTPGVRSVVLGPTHVAEVAAVFPEIADAPACRFRPCTHRTEPGCSVLAALERGTLGAAVYQRYRKLLEEAETR
ncbi:MAG: ribosome small subunit-dependent GTPase A [Hyphomicrobiales bacterium]